MPPSSKSSSILSLLKDMPVVLILLIFLTLQVLYVPLDYVFKVPLSFFDESIQAHASPFLNGFWGINKILLFAHVLFAIPAIIFGPFLLYPKLRKERPKLHKTLGQCYIYGCMLSAVTVIPLALSNSVGPIAHFGFTLMASVWFACCYFGLTAAMNKDFKTHRRWIMRSYALTLAFIHVNFTYRYVLPVHQFTPEGIKAFQSLVSWQINLFILELYLAATNYKERFVGWRQWGRNIASWHKDDRFYGLPIFRDTLT